MKLNEQTQTKEAIEYVGENEAFLHPLDEDTYKVGMRIDGFEVKAFTVESHDLKLGKWLLNQYRKLLEQHSFIVAKTKKSEEVFEQRHAQLRFEAKASALNREAIEQMNKEEQC